jgi:hypothetical protein
MLKEVLLRLIKLYLPSTLANIFQTKAKSSKKTIKKDKVGIWNSIERTLLRKIL